MAVKIKNIRTEIKGLYIRNGSYFLERMINKERLRKKIGRVGSFSLDSKIDKAMAEEEARAKINIVTEFGISALTGVGSVGAGDSGKGKTLKDVLEDYIEKGSKWGTTKTGGEPIAEMTIEGYRKLERNSWKPLMKMPMASINREVIVNWYNELLDNSDKKGFTNIHNDSLRKLVRIFNWAINKNWIEINYAERVYKSDHKVPSKKRKSINEERFDLKTNELGRFIYALLSARTTQRKRNSDTARDLIFTYILTGSRKSEARQMKWDWFEDTKTFRSFTSPPSATKTSKDYYYPCCKLLQELFKRRYENRHKLAEKLGGNSPLTYVFPDTNGKSHITDIRHRLDMVTKVSGIKKHITFHSFRFTFADLCNQLGFEDSVIINAMHHQNTKITFGTYARQNQDILLHKLFQAVEDEVSKSLPLQAVTLTGEYKAITGIIRPSADNIGTESDRFADGDLLRDVLAGRKELSKVAMMIPEVAKINLEFIRKKFPDCPDDYWDRIERFEEIKKQTMAPIYELYKIRIEAYKVIGLIPKDADPLEYKPESKEKGKAMLEQLKEFYGANKLEELKALRKKYFIVRKKGLYLAKDFILLSSIKRFEALTEGKIIINHLQKLLKTNSIDNKKWSAKIDELEEIISQQYEETSPIKKLFKLLDKTYKLKNPILFRYYENIRIAKEERKVIDINKATA